jgi:hypothetical protein
MFRPSHPDMIVLIIDEENSEASHPLLLLSLWPQQREVNGHQSESRQNQRYKRFCPIFPLQFLITRYLIRGSAEATVHTLMFVLLSGTRFAFRKPEQSNTQSYNSSFCMGVKLGPLHRLRMFDNQVLRREFGPKGRWQVDGQNFVMSFHNLSRSRNILAVWLHWERGL